MPACVCLCVCGQMVAKEGVKNAVPTSNYTHPREEVVDVASAAPAPASSLLQWAVDGVRAIGGATKPDFSVYHCHPCWGVVVDSEPKATLGLPSFRRSLTVSLSPQYVIINHLDVPLVLAQAPAVSLVAGIVPPTVTLLPQGQSEWYWTHSKLAKLLSISSPGYCWSGPIDLSAPGDTTVRMRKLVPASLSPLSHPQGVCVCVCVCVLLTLRSYVRVCHPWFVVQTSL